MAPTVLLCTTPVCLSTRPPTVYRQDHPQSIDKTTAVLYPCLSTRPPTFYRQDHCCARPPSVYRQDHPQSIDKTTHSLSTRPLLCSTPVCLSTRLQCSVPIYRQDDKTTRRLVLCAEGETEWQSLPLCCGRLCRPFRSLSLAAKAPVVGDSVGGVGNPGNVNFSHFSPWVTHGLSFCRVTSRRGLRSSGALKPQRFLLRLVPKTNFSLGWQFAFRFARGLSCKLKNSRISLCLCMSGIAVILHLCTVFPRRAAVVSPCHHCPTGGAAVVSPCHHCPTGGAAVVCPSQHCPTTGARCCIRRMPGTDC